METTPNTTPETNDVKTDVSPAGTPDVQPNVPRETPAPTPQIDVDAIVAKAREGLLTKDQVDKIRLEDRKAIATALSGESQKQEQPVDPIHQSFFQDPKAFVNILGSTIKTQLDAEHQAKESDKIEAEKAITSIYKKRVDIASNPTAREMIGDFLAATPVEEGATFESRLNSAITKWDKAAESLGLGSSEDRIKKAADISSDGGSGYRSSTRKFDERELLQKELEERRNYVRSSRNVSLNV